MNGVTAISLAMFFVVAATPSSPVLAAPENLSGSASAYLEAIAADDEPGVAAIVAVNGETWTQSGR